MICHSCFPCFFVCDYGSCFFQKLGILDENERIEDQTLFDIVFRNSKFTLVSVIIITGRLQMNNSSGS